MFTYTLAKDALPLGDYDQKYGQAWWCEVEEHLQPVKFNTMDRIPMGRGQKFTCEERAEKQSSKGTQYYQLRKVRPVVSGASQASPSQTPQNASQSQLDRIEAKLDKLLGIDATLSDPEQAVAQAQAQRDAKDTIHDVGDEPVNLDDIPF